MATKRPNDSVNDSVRGNPGIALLPLTVGSVLMVAMTVLPRLATKLDGQADHLLAVLTFWAMSAGFVRGVGFIPHHPAPRQLFSGLACCIALILAGLRMLWLHRQGWLS